MSYMLAALCWWAILLHRTNVKVFKLESKELAEKYLNNSSNGSISDLTDLPEYQNLLIKFDRQRHMIIGEAIVFGLVLIIGIYFINRAFNSELATAQKQKNFLLSITHELKSPLASIGLILDTIIKRDLQATKVKELSKDALHESTRLNDLFDKILLSTRLGSQNFINKQEIDLSGLLEEIVRKFEKLNPTITLIRDIESDHIKFLDPEAISSIISNLLENALKYKRNIPLRINIKLKKENKMSNLIISDNGIGIPSSEREKIFEQFYRIGSEETRRSKGTGLGLYIVKQLVNEHGGKITVSDSKYGGSKFKIVL